MSEILHIRRIPRARVRLVRVHPPQAVHVDPPRMHEETFTPLHSSAGSSEASAPSPVSDTAPEETMTEVFARGVDEGRRVAEVEFTQALATMRAQEHERLSALLGSIAGQMKTMQESLERDAYRFAVAVAEKIVRREVALHDDIVVRQIQEAMQRIVGVESIKLRVHPSDEAIVREHRTVFLSSLGNLRDVIIETDEGIERGGCFIESTSGNVDARMSTQLRQIETALFGGPSGSMETPS